MLSVDWGERLQTAIAHLRQGRPALAEPILREIAAALPGSGDVRRLLGLALRDRGDRFGAIAELRAALALDPRSGATAVALSELLLADGRAEEALAVVAPLAARPDADLNLLTAHGAVLKALLRRDEAVETYARAVRAAPQSAVAEHNLAAAEADREYWAEAEAATRRAFAKGLDAPETWLVQARALLGQTRHEEAEAAYREVLRRRPFDPDAHGELAQLVWMRTEDASRAVAALDAAIAAYPDAVDLRLKKAEVLDFAGEWNGAYAAVAPAAARPNADPMLHVIAARVSAREDSARALRHAELAARVLPAHPVAQGALCEAYLAVGDIAAARRVAARLNAVDPFDQHSLSLLATTQRLAGDPRYRALYDYEHFVGTEVIETPAGWPNLPAYLADLAESLGRLHKLRTHPVGQSVRHGSQTSQDLTLAEDPVIRAFFRAIDPTIRRRIATLGTGEDILRSRNTGGYRFNGAWSVRLRADGFHANHVHPRGWLSSAFYVALPSAVERGREGWLQFGEPGVRTEPALSAEHWVRPEPGLLALFPSYMWHGTVPFTGDESRLTIAFDIVPRP